MSRSCFKRVKSESEVVGETLIIVRDTPVHRLTWIFPHSVLQNRYMGDSVSDGHDYDDERRSEKREGLGDGPEPELDPN